MKHIVFFLILSMVLVGCEDKDPPSLIVVTTGEATNITFESAKVNVDLSDTKGVKEIGVVYSTDKDFATSQTVKVEESLFTKGGFSLVDLLSQTTYYYKGFAADGLKNMVYGKVKEFITKESTLSVSPSQINADYKEGEYQFQITTESEWIVTSNQTWCTVDKTYGKGNATITVYVTENKDFEERNASITISITRKGIQKNVIIHQRVDTLFLEISDSTFILSKDESRHKVSVNCNKTWEVTCEQTWCKLYPDIDKKSFELSVEENKSFMRTAIITVSSGDNTHAIVVNQLGCNYFSTTNSLILSEIVMNVLIKGKFAFNVSCTGQWKATSDQKWCSVLNPSGENDSVIEFYIEENPYPCDRYAIITVTCGEISQQLLIKQNEKNKRCFTKLHDLIYFTAENNHQSGWGVNFTSPKPLSYSCDQEWCVLESGESVIGDPSDMVIWPYANTTYSNRIAIIRITPQNDKEMFAIVAQGAAPQKLKEDVIPNIEMELIEGGTFIMGGDEKESLPKHKVTLDDFYIGKYEVTQQEWLSIMEYNPSRYKGHNLPVETVRWDQIQEFIEKLNSLSGLNYRLPTEAEWEYAAKGGKFSHGYKYSGSNIYDEVGKREGIYGNHLTYSKGLMKPNELGLYDMSGNVWEWCQDEYAAYPEQEVYNPIVSNTGTYYHVMRDIDTNSISYRMAGSGSYTGKVGFRLARSKNK